MFAHSNNALCSPLYTHCRHSLPPSLPPSLSLSLSPVASPLTFASPLCLLPARSSGQEGRGEQREGDCFLWHTLLSAHGPCVGNVCISA